MATPRKIVQIVVWKNLLIALTDQSELWALNGLEQYPSGSEPIQIIWRKLMHDLPPIEATEFAQAAW